MAYVILDKIGKDQHIESIVATTDLVNGQWVALGALQADGEARMATPSGDQEKELVLHVSNGLVYGDRENELDYKLKAGKVGRGYVVRTGNTVSITFDGVTGTPVVGAKVNPSATGFDIVDGSETVGKIHGEIIAIDIDAIAGKMAVIRISA
ncbi:MULTISPECIES: hypothetical protein [Bacillus cereus group]|uniref:hypothetical protein n=1 Tax=Bacillus cereus group TaxID=86661 RepID=UPI00202CBA3A|nr:MULTISPECIES: hypothetical protein [Bacillus cereus group]MCM0006261.1 hypothetical protein [Bacillus paranthracis]MDX5884884.1 hypothetical protein [Bacillus cereus group sp. BfR-BA-00999]MDX6046802.1 hypothetical protein [Bacillus paranthracis]